METIEWADFERVDIRVGKIVEALEFPRARKPLYRLRIDFGPEIGFRWSAAGIPARYGTEEDDPRFADPAGARGREAVLNGGPT